MLPHMGRYLQDMAQFGVDSSAISYFLKNTNPPMLQEGRQQYNLLHMPLSCWDIHTHNHHPQGLAYTCTRVVRLAFDKQLEDGMVSQNTRWKSVSCN
eukprot:scaffold11440_cov53-Attheya_sp.AAC.1